MQTYIHVCEKIQYVYDLLKLKVPLVQDETGISPLPAVALNTSSQPSLSSFATVRGSPPNAFGLQTKLACEKETKSSDSSSKFYKRNYLNVGLPYIFS